MIYLISLGSTFSIFGRSPYFNRTYLTPYSNDLLYQKSSANVYEVFDHDFEKEMMDLEKNRGGWKDKRSVENRQVSAEEGKEV
jgi:hypothetical protein